MRIDIITLFPEFFNTYIQYSILKRAQKNKLAEINIHNLRDYSTNKQNNIDDYQFGGGAGMVLCIEPIDNCIKHLKKQVKYDEIIYLSPDGEKLNQKICNSLSLNNNLILLCGHYKGIDQRARDHLVTKEISIGDYVITGGEVAAAILSDAIIRLIPGVISDGTSALTDTFQDDIIAPPIYTRPSNYNGWKVPDVLLSGNKRLISEWRDKESLRITKNRRPDLLK